MTNRPPLVLIAGPTASGKSDLAVRLAQKSEDRGQRAVIINADSAQVYQDLSILSARPQLEEMGGIDHRLFGAWDGAQACSAADWADAAKTEIVQAHASGALPILVGGTGLYMRTLLEGISPIPAIDSTIRDQVRAMPLEEAYSALQQQDPARAAILAPADSARITRALEVILSTGHPMAYWQQQLTGGIKDTITLHPLVLLPERSYLYERCDRRFSMMFDNGALEEVRALLQRNLRPDLPVMRAIGVPQMAAYLQGHSSRDEAIEQGAQATRNYAKRQYTWFRRQTPDNWPKVGLPDAEALTLFEILLQ